MEVCYNLKNKGAKAWIMDSQFNINFIMAKKKLQMSVDVM